MKKHLIALALLAACWQTTASARTGRESGEGTHAAFC